MFSVELTRFDFTLKYKDGYNYIPLKYISYLGRLWGRSSRFLIHQQ